MYKAEFIGKNMYRITFMFSQGVYYVELTDVNGSVRAYSQNHVLERAMISYNTLKEKFETIGRSEYMERRLTYGTQR